MALPKAVLASGLALLVACADSAPSPVAPHTAGFTHVPSDIDAVIDGSTGPGSVYRLARPANWNGNLLIYAHGYTLPEAPVGLPAEGDLFTSLLLPQGFAVAYSSFSENGWSVKDGTQRTHQLLGLFTSKFGAPERIYIGGASMGGLIAIRLAETHPKTYSGAIAACAVSGGTRQLFEYHAHVRALFDFFYPGVLPGDAATLPDGTDVTLDIILPALAAMTADPAPAFQLAAIDQAPVPWASPDELLESIASALAGHAAGVADELLTHGKPYFDNQGTLYSSPVLPAPLLQVINASVDRFAALPSALAGLDHNYTPSGDLRIPMLMLSNVRDPVMPGFNQQSYASVVAANGAADLLVQRVVPTFGHCVFTAAEIGAAVSDLVLWAQFGIKPVP